jgi:hypothetical protein
VNPTSTPGGLDTFGGERPRLTGLAVRITCSLADAEDVVQEVWIRWACQDAAAADKPGRLAHDRHLPPGPRPSAGTAPAARGLRRAVAS